ncbi:hypothetical protein EVAR_30307_1 [Eumeta japonica]|uniref:Uncharacterized protein n=1 Tax=Eumeta variegata TaxID=151549 RepID=A0A4C1W980_EUMVA|nr:hypothetical protein EVAR_30307_1 [Eumeta japonica]
MSIHFIPSSNGGPVFDSGSGLGLRRLRPHSRSLSLLNFGPGTTSHSGSGRAPDSNFDPSLDFDLEAVPMTNRYQDGMAPPRLRAPARPTKNDGAGGAYLGGDKFLKEIWAVPLSWRP